jgi:hypothetical protein
MMTTTAHWTDALTSDEALRLFAQIGRGARLALDVLVTGRVTGEWTAEQDHALRETARDAAAVQANLEAHLFRLDFIARTAAAMDREATLIAELDARFGH